MIDKKCMECSELVIPYFHVFAKPNPKLPENIQVGTCKCNIDLVNRRGEGYYGWCHPEECNGAGHRYYFDYNKHHEIIFID